MRDATRLNTEVIAATPVPGSAQRTIESRVAGQAATTTETVDFVIVCDGILAEVEPEDLGPPR